MSRGPLLVVLALASLVASCAEQTTASRGAKGGDGDKRVSLEARINGHPPVAVHAEADRIDIAVGLAADKAVRAIEHAVGRERAH